MLKSSNNSFLSYLHMIKGRDMSTICPTAKSKNRLQNTEDLESDCFYSALHQLCIQVTGYSKEVSPASSDTGLWHNLSHWQVSSLESLENKPRGLPLASKENRQQVHYAKKHHKFNSYSLRETQTSFLRKVGQQFSVYIWQLDH